MLIIGLSGSLAFGQDKPAVDATIDPSHTELAPGDYVRQIIVGDRKRTYIVHVPEGYDAKKTTPVVLALHGAGMNGSMMVWFTGLNKTSDAKGFIVV